MKLASSGPCTLSFDTTRKNVGYLPVVSAAAVADPEMNASPARAIRGPTASTSWLPAGPTTATIFVFEVNCWVTVVAIDGVSCVSPWTIEIWVWLAALSIDTASSAKWSCSCPSDATGPVSGPSMPVEATHAVVAALLVLVLALLLLLLLELLQPATTSAPTAATAMITLFLIGYAPPNIRDIFTASGIRSRRAGPRPTAKLSLLAGESSLFATPSGLTAPHRRNRGPGNQRQDSPRALSRCRSGPA